MDSQSEEINALRSDLDALDRVRLRLNERLERLLGIQQALAAAGEDAAHEKTGYSAPVIDLFSRFFPPRGPRTGEIA